MMYNFFEDVICGVNEENNCVKVMTGQILLCLCNYAFCRGMCI